MRYKILFLSLSSILVALLVQTLLFWHTSAKTIYDQTKETNIHSLNNMQEDIDDIVKGIESKMIEVYNQKKLMQDLQSYQAISIMKQNNYRVAYTMAQSFDMDSKVVALYVYDDFNRIISTYRHAVTPVYNYPEDVFLDSYAYNVKPLRRFMNQEKNIMLISSYYNESRGKNIIRFALNIFDRENLRKQIGCVVCDIDSDVFQKILKKYSYTDNHLIWLQPIGDRPIVTAGTVSEEYQNEFENLAADIGAGKTEQELDLKINGEVLFNLSDTKYNLEIFSLMPPSMLIENQNILNRNLIIIAVILILLFGTASIMMTKSITEPLEYLTNTIRKIRKGDTKLRVNPLGNDEIGELGDNFNKMLNEMEQLIAQKYKSQIMLQRAEYKALQAQINPHFLYNTLDTISSIAQIQENPLVGSLSESLSAIFRYALDMKEPLATVEKEILHLKNYIYVMDVRMNHSIQYQFQIDDNLLQIKVPRLTLQPIVENALKYGVRSIKGEKRVDLTIQETEDKIVICVKDNGTGFSPDHINAQLQENHLSYVEKGDSIGLHNINARIKLLFGEEYGVTIISGVNEGTQVKVTIPREKGELNDEWDKVSFADCR